MKILYVTKTHVEDSIAASTLASACIDVYNYEEFYESSKTIINTCYSIFVDELKDNMKLNDDLTPQSPSVNDFMIRNRVVIEEFSYYRIYEDGIYKTTKDGEINEYLGALGTVASRDGNIIVTQTLYSRIGVYIENPITHEIQYVTKDFTVDITVNERE